MPLSYGVDCLRWAGQPTKPSAREQGFHLVDVELADRPEVFPMKQLPGSCVCSPLPAIGRQAQSLGAVTEVQDECRYVVCIERLISRWRDDTRRTLLFIEN